MPYVILFRVHASFQFSHLYKPSPFIQVGGNMYKPPSLFYARLCLSQATGESYLKKSSSHNCSIDNYYSSSIFLLLVANKNIGFRHYYQDYGTLIFSDLIMPSVPPLLQKLH